MDFREDLYEALVFSYGKILSQYDPQTYEWLIKEIGKELMSYLIDKGYPFADTGALEDIEQAMKTFVQYGFADRIEVSKGEHADKIRWHNLFGKGAYEKLQDITENPFISCPLNAALFYLADKHNKTLKLYSKCFFPEENVVESEEGIIDRPPRPEGTPPPFSIAGVERDAIEQEKAQRLEESLRELRREITTRKRAEMEATRASQAKSFFLSAMSHELRTPMNAIMGMLQVIQDTSLDEEQKQFLGIASKAAEKLMFLLNDVLEYSQIESGTLESEMADFDLITEVQDLIETYRSRFAEKGLALNYRIGASLPRWVHGDRQRIVQILGNLLTNALKFTPTGQVDLSVEAESKSAESVQLLFEVADTGVGIPQDQLGRVFEYFTQVRSKLYEHVEGSGLGLAISKRLAESLGGKLWAESQVGQGSRFFLSLRLHLAQAEQGADPSEDVASKLAGARVLVVEDSVESQLVLNAFLKQHKAHTTLANNAAEALAAIKEKPFDLILMDLRLPDQSGLELTEQIRASAAPFSDVPIIAITAHAFAEDERACLDVGMNAYLSKPLKLEQLVSVASALL